MEQKFKIGDRVKDKVDGSLGRVTRFDQRRYVVRWDMNSLSGVDCVWDESELELVQEEIKIQDAPEKDEQSRWDMFAMTAMQELLRNGATDPGNVAWKAMTIADKMVKREKEDATEI